MIPPCQDMRAPNLIEHHKLGIGDERIEMSSSCIDGFLGALAGARAQPTRKCPFEGVDSIDYRRRRIARSTRNMLTDHRYDAVAAFLPYFRAQRCAGQNLLDLMKQP